MSNSSEAAKRHEVAKKFFVQEYNALCRKWGLFIVSEDPYCGIEIESIHMQPELHTTQLKQLKK